MSTLTIKYKQKRKAISYQPIWYNFLVYLLKKHHEVGTSEAVVEKTNNFYYTYYKTYDMKLELANL